MELCDTELIKRARNRDESACRDLVDKYKTFVSGRVYNKCGDFLTVEDIEDNTQEIFLKVFKDLQKNHKDKESFRSWLCRIIDNHCTSLFRQKCRRSELFDEAMEQRNTELWAKWSNDYIRKAARDAIKGLSPSELSENRRIALDHSLAGQTPKEIGNNMDGRSDGAIRDLLHRGRQNVKENMPKIKENLRSFQLPPVVEREIMRRIPKEIMRQIPNGSLNSAPTTSKPLVPWIVGDSIAIGFALFIGSGIGQPTEFQPPGSLDAFEWVGRVERVDKPAKEPLLKLSQINQARGSSGGESENENQENDPVQKTAADSQSIEKNDIALDKGSWIQTNGPYGGIITALHATPEGVLFAGTLVGGIFHSADHGKTWKPTSEGLPGYHGSSHSAIRTLAQTGDILYAHTDNDFFYSTNRGDSWQQLAELNVSGIAIIGDTIYIGQQGQEKVSFSNDSGKSWRPFDKGLPDQGAPTLFAVGTTLFAQMQRHVFRRKAGESSWTKLTIKERWLPFGPWKKNTVESGITKFAISSEIVYAVTADGGLLRSTDNGDWWQSIKPQEMQDFDGELAMMGNTVFYIDDGRVFRSIDAGNSWKILDINFPDQPLLSMVISSEKTFHIGTYNGVFRSTDGGKSWAKATTGIPHTDEEFVVLKSAPLTIMGSGIVKPFVSFRNALYTLTGDGIVKSADGGNSWVLVNDGLIANDGAKLAGLEGLHLWAGAELTVSGGKLYAATCESSTNRWNPGTSGIYYLAEDESSWLPVHPNMPSFNAEINSIDQLAVSGETFYVVAATQVYRWRVGEDLWTNLGLRVLDEEGLAVSGRTVYVATYVDVAIREEEFLRLQKGKLLRSVDEGNTWTDVSQHLPNWDLQSKQNYEQVGYDLHFAGETIYAGSDYKVLQSIGDDKTRHYDDFYGVFRSTDGGKTWKSIVDGLPSGSLNIKLVYGTTLYATNSHGIFRLTHGSDSWEKLASMVPVSKPPVFGTSAITSLAFDGTAFYANTWKGGIFRLSLAE